MSSRHHVSELDAINGTKLRPKSRPESGPSWDHVETKSGPSGDQVIFQSTQSPTQLHKISSPHYCIKYVTEQVGEQVTEQVRSLLICLEDYTSSDGLYRKTSGNNPLSQPPRTSCHYHPEPPR